MTEEPTLFWGDAGTWRLGWWIQSGDKLYGVHGPCICASAAGGMQAALMVAAEMGFQKVHVERQPQHDRVDGLPCTDPVCYGETLGESKMTISVTPEFLDHLLAEAESARLGAAHGGRMDDGGASHVSELICAFKAGRDGKIPSFWVEPIQRFNQTQNEEFKLYQRLKRKYETQ